MRLTSHLKISQVQLPPQIQTRSVDWNTVGSAYDYLIDQEQQERPDGVYPALSTIINGGSSTESDVPFDKITVYRERLGCSLAASAGGHAFFNGKHFDVDEVCLSDFLSKYSYSR